MDESKISAKILKEVKVIPPLSRTAAELIQVLDSERHTIDDVVDVVSCDPMLAGQLLKISNCAAFARRNPVDTISGAVSYLGDKLVVGIALGATASSIYDAPLDGYEGKSGVLWLHSLRTAIAAREISKYTDKTVTSGVAYTSGLLHDIGKAVLSVHLRDKTEDIVKLIEENPQVDFCEAERKFCGVTHCDIGLLLAQHWNLPDSLKTVIEFHHTPSEAPDRYKALCYVSHLADMVAMMAGTGTGTDTMRYTFDSNYIDFINIDRHELDRMLLVLGIEFGKTESAIEDIK